MASWRATKGGFEGFEGEWSRAFFKNKVPGRSSGPTTSLMEMMVDETVDGVVGVLVDEQMVNIEVDVMVIGEGEPEKYLYGSKGPLAPHLVAKSFGRTII
jgi:hypothetical protein